MSYANVKLLVSDITKRLDKHNIIYHVHHSRKSPSMYIKVGKATIRVSDHYSSTDNFCQYNIGYHIRKINRSKGSLYYKSNKVDQLVKKLIKDRRRYKNGH